MKSTFIWKLTDGREARIEAEYVCEMGNEIINLDGDEICVGKKAVEYAYMTVYVGGKQLETSSDFHLWNLVDTPKLGIKKIRGMKIAFNEENALRYQTWIETLITEGTTEEVKAYRTEEEQKKNTKKIAEAKKIITEAEKQATIPSKKEAERIMKEYNDIHNEGGYGFVPYIINIEEYKQALKVVEDDAKKSK